ncbi:MAG: hypothetical protein V4558_02350 [Gemmatimonadota bacterium]
MRHRIIRFAQTVMLLLATLGVPPTLTAQSAPGPRATTVTVGLRQPLHTSAPPAQPAMRRYDNNGWLIGAIGGGIIGAWAARRTGDYFTIIVSAVLVAAVGSLIGGVLASK